MGAFDPKVLIDKITALPTDLIVEVENFVDLISKREQDRSLARIAAATSAPSFAAVWSNPEDDAYDAL